jgi:hypothetical protein
VELKPSHYTEARNNGTKINYYEIKNKRDLYFELNLSDGNTTSRVVLYPNSTQLVTANANSSTLTAEVVSTYIRSDQHLKVDFDLR